MRVAADMVPAMFLDFAVYYEPDYMILLVGAIFMNAVLILLALPCSVMWLREALKRENRRLRAESEACFRRCFTRFHERLAKMETRLTEMQGDKDFGVMHSLSLQRKR